MILDIILSSAGPIYTWQHNTGSNDQLVVGLEMMNQGEEKRIKALIPTDPCFTWAIWGWIVQHQNGWDCCVRVLSIRQGQCIV